jgi:hypothetical protein
MLSSPVLASHSTPILGLIILLFLAKTYRKIMGEL